MDLTMSIMLCNALPQSLLIERYVQVLMFVYFLVQKQKIHRLSQKSLGVCEEIWAGTSGHLLHINTIKQKLKIWFLYVLQSLDFLCHYFPLFALLVRFFS